MNTFNSGVVGQTADEESVGGDLSIALILESVLATFVEATSVVSSLVETSTVGIVLGSLSLLDIDGSAELFGSVELQGFVEG